MNITWPVSRKNRDIVKGSPQSDIDSLVERLYSDMNRQAVAIGDYLVDLANDVTGILPPTGLGADSPGSITKFYREDGVFAEVPVTGFTQRQSSRISAWMIVTDDVTFRDIGLASTGGAGAIQKDSGGYWRRMNTSGASGVNVNRTSTGSVVFWADHDPFLEVNIRTGSNITNLRYWVGIFSAVPTNADTITGRVLAFRYSTVVPDSGWTYILRDNTTTTVGTAVGGAVAASTIYRLGVSVESNGTTVTFSVNGVETEVAVPAGILGNDLWWGVYLFANEAAVKSFDIKSAYYEHD